MTATVLDLPVVVIVILGKRVTVDGEPIYHDGSRPLAEVAAEAVAEGFARPLGRPVRALASDQSGTCMLVVNPNGTWSQVSTVTSTESEHFPESGMGSMSLVSGASLPGVAVSHSLIAPKAVPVRRQPRRRLVLVLTAAALLVAAAGLAGRLSRDDAVRLVAEPLPPASASPTHAPPKTPPPSASESPGNTRITGSARQRPGGPVRLTIRSSVAPLNVDVVLVPLGGKEPVRRSVLISDAAARGQGRSVQLFAELEPQVYHWEVSAGGKVVTGKVRVRAAPPADATVREVVPELVPEPTASSPSAPAEPSRPPPAGPRGNQPIPPTPQP